MKHEKNLLQQAQTLQKQGELESADKIYAEYYALQPQDLAAAHQWCILKLQRRELKAAEKLINTLLQQDPENIQLLITSAKILTEEQDYSAAEKIYLDILQAHPTYLPIHLHLGNLYFHLDKLEAAIEQYNLLLKDNPHPEIRFNYALALTKQSQLDTAIDELNKVLKADPQHLKAHFQLAEIYREQTNFSAASGHYQAVIAKLPSHIDANLGLAFCYDQQGQAAQAIAQLQPFAEMQPPALELHELLAKIYTEQHDQHKALKHYQACLSIQREPIYLYNIAVIYMHQQRHKEALMYFNAILEIEPQHFETLQNVGSIYLKMRNGPAAISAYERALPLASNPDEIQHILAALKDDAPPAMPPESFVTNLFNSYAPRYDEHLLDFLKYKVPAAIQAILEQSSVLESHNLRVVDTGCGTGLCAKFIRPYCQSLIGIDLAADMLAIAADKKLYDRLIEGELTQALRDLPEQDLIIAADVLTYFGELDGVFAAAAASLVAGGHFVFSVERLSHTTDQAPDFALQKSLRYAHHRDYISRIANVHQFVLEDLHNAIIREDHGRPIEGYIVLLKHRPA